MDYIPVMLQSPFSLFEFPKEMLNEWRPNQKTDVLRVLPFSSTALSLHSKARFLQLRDIGAFYKAKGHNIYRSGGVNAHILIWCLQGKGLLYSRSLQTEIVAKRYLWICPNHAHAYFAQEKDPWTIFWMHFSGTEAEALARSLGKGKPIFVADLPFDPLRQSLFSRILHLLNLPSDTLAPLQINLVLAALLQTFFPPPRLTSKPLSKTDQCYHYLIKNLNGKESLTQIAKMSGLSRSQLCDTFQKKYGYPPLTFRLRANILQAAQSLLASSEPVAAIARQSGFQDPLYFSRQFKKIIGRSPRQYRNDLLGLN